MSQTKIMEELDNILKKNEQRYYSDSVLNKARVIEDLHNYDPELITLLSDSEVVKKHFLIEIKGDKILKINDLIEIFEMNEYWDDSYTAYENKIGLTSDGKFLSDNTEIVLEFPYKDTVLKASMSKEEREKEDLLPEEPFLNEKIAREEIDTLFDKKILINATKYNEEGGNKVVEFSENDNLILKGNNLLALHTIRNHYKGKVKLVYIDPPYNTDSAANTFSYNNNFNHSSFLTFLKNRVEVAKEFLQDDGFFVVSIDDNELFYLGVLLDEILGRENRLGVISVVHNPGGRQDEKFFPTAHENMIVYANDRDKADLNNLPISRSKLKEYIYEDDIGKYKLRGFRRSGNNSLRTERPNLFYPIYYNPETEELSLKQGKNTIEILPIDTSNDERCWRWGKESFVEQKDDYLEVVKTNGKYDIYVKERATDYRGEKPKTIWNKSEYTGQNATNTLKKIFNDKVFTYPKSEFLLRDIVHIFTNENDIIIDFFMGSATTQAVAHKMNRRYVGVEQMDYINTVSVPRLQQVIEGEQGGVSQDVNWKGGGSFVYVELMEKNTGYLKNILNAESTDYLKEIFNLMLENADFDFRVDLEEVKNSVWRLSLEEQKRTLVKIIDKNQLYYNYSEIDDVNVRELISDSDYVFNKSFYDNTGDEDE